MLKKGLYKSPGNYEYYKNFLEVFAIFKNVFFSVH